MNDTMTINSKMTDVSLNRVINNIITNTNKVKNDVNIKLINTTTNDNELEIKVCITVANQHRIYNDGCVYTLFYHKFSTTPFYQLLRELGCDTNQPINGWNYTYLMHPGGSQSNEYITSYYVPLE